MYCFTYHFLSWAYVLVSSWTCFHFKISVPFYIFLGSTFHTQSSRILGLRSRKAGIDLFYCLSKTSQVLIDSPEQFQTSNRVVVDANIYTRVCSQASRLNSASYTAYAMPGITIQWDLRFLAVFVDISRLPGLTCLWPQQDFTRSSPPTSIL